MQHVILHIGRHKTGTSSLQHTLHTNKVQLADAGIHYPETGLDRIAHHNLANRLCDPAFDPQQDEMLSNLLSEIRTCGKDTILISSEGFQRCKPKVVKAAFADFNVSVVVYLRDQLSYLQSSYLQVIHATGYHGSIEDYEPERFSANYVNFLTPWEKVFGREHVTTRIFSKPLLTDGDLVSDFFHAVLEKDFGLTVNYVPVDADLIVTNPSLKGAAIPFKLRFNTIIENEHYYFGKLYKALGLYSRTVTEPVNLISEALFTQLEKEYQASNRTLLEKLSLPSNALDFRKYDFHQSVDWMAPETFYEVLCSLTELVPECEVLMENCYHVTIEEDAQHWRLRFCPNIQLDSLELVRIYHNNTEQKLTDTGKPDGDAYTLSRDSFNPATDRLGIDFESGRSQNIAIVSGHS